MNRFISADLPVWGIRTVLFVCACFPSTLWAGDSAADLNGRISDLLSLTPESVSSKPSAEETLRRFENVVEGLLAIGDLDQALRVARHCLKVFPNTSVSRVLVGRVSGLRGHLDEAIGILRSVLGKAGSTAVEGETAWRLNAMTHLAGFLIEKGSCEEALAYLDEVIQAEPDRAVAYYLSGLAYNRIGDWYSSARSYREALKRNPDLAGPSDFILYARALDEMEQYERARKVLEKGVRRFPSVPGLYVNLGLNAEARHATREAFYHYRMELLAGGKETPYAEHAKKRIRRILSIQHQTTVPDKQLQSVIEHLRNLDKNPSFQKMAAEESSGSGNNGKPLPELPTENHPLIDYLRSEELLEKEDYREAVRVLKEALEKYPGQVLFKVDLATAYARIGDTTRAEELLNEVILSHPHHWKVDEVLGPVSGASLTAGK